TDRRSHIDSCRVNIGFAASIRILLCRRCPPRPTHEGGSMKIRKRFRQLIDEPKLLVMPGAYDGLSARIIEDQGYDAITAGGYAAAGSLLGQPDTGQSNMRYLASHYG